MDAQGRIPRRSARNHPQGQAPRVLARGSVGGSEERIGPPIGLPETHGSTLRGVPLSRESARCSSIQGNRQIRRNATESLGDMWGATRTRCGTTLVPTATSDASRSSTVVDDLDRADAHGHIYMSFRSAGGRKVASSNLAAPTTRKPAREAGFRHVGGSYDRPAKGSWYQPWYREDIKQPPRRRYVAAVRWRRTPTGSSRPLRRRIGSGAQGMGPGC